jgi:glucose-1-phosphate thymidylyltransferase
MKRKIKGVILAGGRGTRLHPLTLATNKHLLPIYNKPVIYHAVEKLVEAGIDHIMVVCSPEYNDLFVRLLGSGTAFKSKRTGKQIQIVYGIQNEPNGVAYALRIAKEYVGTDHCFLYLGDNIIEDNLASYVKNFKGGATVFMTKVDKPEHFGIAEFKNGKIVEIVEKPKNPKSDLAVIGAYIYDNDVFQKMAKQKPSLRGEYEITWVNNQYAKEGKLTAVELKEPWFDIGSFDNLLAASLHVRNKHYAKDKKTKK